MALLSLNSPEVAGVEDASSPSRISARGWLWIAVETVRATLKHRAPATAAAISFYGLLAFIPAVAAFGATYGLFAGPDALGRQLNTLGGLVPLSVIELVRKVATRFSHAPAEKLVFTALFFAAVSVTSASSAVRVLMSGLNTVNRTTEGRHFVKRRLLSFLFAGGIAIALAADVALIVRSSDFLNREGDVFWPTVRLLLRWASLFGLSVGALAVLYRYGPDRTRARWRWVTPGSVLAAVVGLATSAGMSAYLGHVSNYERNYGGLGSVMGLAVWMWASVIVLLGGAELNHAMECRTSAITDVTGRETEGVSAAEPLVDCSPPQAPETL